MISAHGRNFQKLKPNDSVAGNVNEHPPLAENPVSWHDSFEQRLSELKLWGRNTHSFLSLYGGLKYFSVPGVEGYIPLIITHDLILISGEPVCDVKSVKVLISALAGFARSKKCSIGAIPVSESAMQLMESIGFDIIYIGKEPIFDLHNLPKVSKSIRLAANRAKRKGFRVVGYDPKYRSQIESLCHKWLDDSELPPMGFLFQLRPLELHTYKKYFLAVDESEKLVAFLACSPIYARNGWYLEDLVREHNAPNGCTEMLVTEALATLAAEGFNMATLAIAPLAGMPDFDESHPILNGILRLCYRYLSFVYHFQSLEHFKGKFHPSHWEKNYFCVYRTGQRMGVTGSLLRALLPNDILAIVRHKISRCPFL